MDKVTSSDGTSIAFERLGDGPPVIAVCGAMCDRALPIPGNSVGMKRAGAA